MVNHTPLSRDLRAAPDSVPVSLNNTWTFIFALLIILAEEKVFIILFSLVMIGEKVYKYYEAICIGSYTQESEINEPSLLNFIVPSAPLHYSFSKDFWRKNAGLQISVKELIYISIFHSFKGVPFAMARNGISQ